MLYALGIPGFNIDLARIWQTIGLIAQLVVVGLIVLAFVIFMRYFMKFNKKVILFMKAGDGWTMKDNERGFMNHKKRDFQLMRNKNLLVSVPESKHTFLKKGKEVFIGAVINGSVSWLTITENPHFIPADMNMMNFAVDMYARIDEATKTKLSFWDKYGHQILWGISMMVFLVVIILILQRMDKIIGMAQAVPLAQGKQAL